MSAEQFLGRAVRESVVHWNESRRSLFPVEPFMQYSKSAFTCRTDRQSMQYALDDGLANPMGLVAAAVRFAWE